KATPAGVVNGADSTKCVAGPGVTVCVKLLLLPLKFASPLYVALMVWLAMLRLETLKLAELPKTPTGEPARTVAPSLKVMAPVAVPPKAGAIVALKVTEEFTMEE